MTHTLLRMATAKKCEVDSQNENDEIRKWQCCWAEAVSNTPSNVVTCKLWSEVDKLPTAANWQYGALPFSASRNDNLVGLWRRLPIHCNGVWLAHLCLRLISCHGASNQNIAPKTHYQRNPVPNKLGDAILNYQSLTDWPTVGIGARRCYRI